VADRTASVALKLEAGQFKSEALIVEKKIGDVDSKVEKLDRDITKIPADAARAAVSMKLLGGDVGSVDDKISSLGEKNVGLATLDAKIRTSRSEVRKLADEFVKTGDIDVFRKLGNAEGHLRGLTEVRKKLASTLVDGVEDAARVIPKELAKTGVQAGQETAKSFSAGFQGILSTPLLGPAVIAALIAAALPVVGALTAAIGGALGLGGAVGGAGLGLAGAWMGDPQKYGALWSKSIDGIQQRWMRSSAAFGNELEDALKIVDRTLRDLPIERILAISQGFVGPLAGGIGAGITAAVDGFADALARAQPIVDKVAPALANLGHDLGDSIRIISMGSKQGGDALSDLIGVIGYVTKAVSLLVLGFELAYGAVRDFATEANSTAHSVPVLGSALDYINEKLYHIGVTGVTAGMALDDLGASASASSVASNAAAASARGMGNALDELRQKAFAAADANLALAQGWFDLEKELENGKRVLNDNSEAGVANEKAVLSQIEAADKARRQQIELAGGVNASTEAIANANAEYDRNIAKIRATALALGYTKAEVDRYIASVVGIPPAAETKITTPGMFDALTAAARLSATLGGLDRTYSPHVAISGMGAALADAARLAATLSRAGQSRDNGRALGGPVSAGVPYVVGDGGRPEVFVPDTNGTIIPSVGQYASMQQGGFGGWRQMGSSGGGGGVQTVHHVVDIVGHGELIRRVIIADAANRGQSVETFLGIG